MKPVPLKEVAQIIMGTAPPGASYNNSGKGLPMIAGAGDYGPETPCPKKWTTQPSAVSEPGDLIVCVRATIGDLNWADKKYCLGRGVAALRPKNGSVDVRYLAHFVNANKAALSRLGTGSTFLAIRRGDIENFEIPLPPLAEQKRIADILDKADAIRRKRKEAIEEFAKLRASVFSEMFSQKMANAKWTGLSKFLVDLRYGTSSKSGKNGYTTLRIPNIVRGIIDLAHLKTVDASEAELERLRLVDGDVLFVRTNGNPDYVGRCAVFESSQMQDAGLKPDQIIYASYLIRARLQQDQLRPMFLQSLLQTRAGRKNVREKCRTSAGQYNINTKGIGSLQIPEIHVEEQLAFENLVASLRPTLQKISTAETDSDELFNSLVQVAFKGDL